MTSWINALPASWLTFSHLSLVFALTKPTVLEKTHSERSALLPGFPPVTYAYHYPQTCRKLSKLRWPRRAFRFCLRATQIVRFAQRKLGASLNGNCVLLPTRFAQRKLCASPNALRSTQIVCFAQQKMCASPNVTQHKLCASPNATITREDILFHCYYCPSRMPLLSLHVTNNGLY